ncbi:MAG: TonB-dependent receptor [Gemmatimonadales bacterium]
MNKWWCRIRTALGASCLVALAASPLAAQSLRGTVTDSATQRLLEGAVVSIVGRSQRVQTRADGEYTFEQLAPGPVTVRVRMIGYAAADREVTVAEGETVIVDFLLQPRAIELEELVSIGYGTQARADLTTAVGSVTGDEIANQPVAGVDAALQGKIAGVQITQNAGNPGNAISVRIRGSASLTASNQPLFVIDGVPMVSEDISQLDFGGQGINGVSGLSSGDIESIDVLKDAAANAIYGSRGSNGVVMITTKRGKSGKALVSFNASTGTQRASRRLPLMNATQYLTYFNEAAANDGYGPDYFGVVGVDDQSGSDWQDAVLRSAPVTNAEMAVSGGNERVRYRASGNYFDQNGIVIASQYQRLGGRVNLDFDASSRLSFTSSLAITGEDNHRIEGDGSGDGIITNVVGESPLTPVKINGVYNTPSDGLNYVNPVALANFNTATARTTRVLGDIEARFELVPSFAFTSRVGVDLLTLREKQFQSRRVGGTYAASANGVAKSDYSISNRYVFDNFGTLDRSWGKNSLQVTAGTSLEMGRGESNFIRGEGFTNDHFTEVQNATIIISYDGTHTENNLISYFGRVNYSLAGKYFLGGSVRTDASSRFAPDNRWGWFPAVSGAWLLSEEPFLRGGSVDNLKLRASYGRTGNQSISDYPFQGLSCSANYVGEGGTAPCTLANQQLGWERTNQLDVGVDLGLWDRVSLTADYYHKNTQGLLFFRPITPTSGFPGVYSNVGTVVNKGFELGLSAELLRPATTGALGLTTSLNIAVNRNKVTSLFDDQPYSTGERDFNRVAVGHSIGEFYTLKFEGVDPATGDAIYKDVDGDGSITSSDRTFVGSPHPDYTGGLTSTLTWKGFDLKAFLDFSQGGKVFNAMRLFSGVSGYYTDNHFTDALDRWQNAGDKTNEPRASYDGNSGGNLRSSRFIEDGSYWRMQDVTLGYQLPASFARSTGFRTARVYLSAHNLFTISDFTGYNPDVNSNGTANDALSTDFYAYPLARTWSFGIQAGW